MPRSIPNLKKTQKLVLVSTTALLVIDLRNKTMREDLKIPKVTPLQRTPYIRYLVQIQKSLKIQVLINFSSEINVMTPTYVIKLDLSIWKTNVKVQKIEKSTIVTYTMVITWFSLQNNLKTV